MALATGVLPHIAGAEIVHPVTLANQQENFEYSVAWM
jgi:hypothetical protein